MKGLLLRGNDHAFRHWETPVDPLSGQLKMEIGEEILAAYKEAARTKLREPSGQLTHHVLQRNNMTGVNRVLTSQP